MECDNSILEVVTSYELWERREREGKSVPIVTPTIVENNTQIEDPTLATIIKLTDIDFPNFDLGFCYCDGERRDLADFAMFSLVVG